MLLDLEGWHDVLLTGIEGDEVRLFDPYYCAKPFGDPTLQMVMDHPDAYNRIVPVSYLGREAVLLRNRRTELTEERTVEYVI